MLRWRWKQWQRLRLTYRSLWLVRSCGCTFLELASGVPIILSCNRRPPFLKLSDAFLVIELSLLVIVGKQYSVMLRRTRAPITRRRQAQVCGESTSTLSEMAFVPNKRASRCCGKAGEERAFASEHPEACRMLKKGVSM